MIRELLRRRRRLRELGVLGINRRNAAFVLPGNPRRYYPRVDDKRVTKRLAAAAGIPIPALLGAVSHYHQLRGLPRLLDGLAEFVLKPAHGAQGNGIAVIAALGGDGYEKSTGARLTVADIRQHVANIISGVFSLTGDTDSCLIEERVGLHPAFATLACGGIPDVRLIVYRGVPVMAMCRLPTRESDGRANLHQGAIGVGLDLRDGRAVHAAHHHHSVVRHVDTGEPLIGFTVPEWERVLSLGTRASDLTGLAYVGVDIVIDGRHGPQLLEFNARPGLGIQLANHEGLLPRLRAVDETVGAGLAPWADRCARAREMFGGSGRAPGSAP